MARQVLDIVRRYQADTSQWQQALKSIDRSSASTARSMQRMEQRTKKLEGTMGAAAKAGKALGASLAGAFSVNAVLGTISATASKMDDLGNAANRVGLAASGLQALRFESEKLGLSTQAVDTAIQRFGRRVAEANKGTGVLAKVFKEYGISLKDSSGNQKDVNKLLTEFQTVLKGIEDPMERNRVSMAAFDAEGVKFGQTLFDMKGSIEEITDLLRQQGIIIGDNTVQRYRELATAQTTLNTQWQVLKTELLLPITEKLITFTRTLSQLVEVSRNLVAPLQAIALEFERITRIDFDAISNAFNWAINPVGSAVGGISRALGIGEAEQDLEALGRQLVKVNDKITALSSKPAFTGLGAEQDNAKRNEKLNKLYAEQSDILVKIKQQEDALATARDRAANAGAAGGVSLPKSVPDTTGFSKAADDLREWEQVVIRTLKLNQTQAKRFTQLSSAFDAASKKFGVDRNLLVAIAKQESGFNRLAKSTAGAIGVMQLMPGTAKDIARQTGIAYEDLVSTAVGNIEGGAFYIAKRLKQLGGDVTKALAAYNAGIGNVQKYGGVPPFKETQGYVANIIPDYERLSNATGNLSVATARWSEAQALQNALLQKAQGVIQSVLTPAEQYVAQLAELRSLLEEGVLAEEYYVRAVEKASSVYQNATSGAEQYKTAVAGLGETTKAIGQEITNNVQGAFSSWIDSAVEGTFRLQDALRGLLKDLAKLALNNALKGIFSGLGGGGGILGAIGSIFGNAHGNAFPQLALPQGVYNQPTVFPMPSGGALKRYARGGLLGEAGPEAILPLRRTASGDLGVQGGGTTVQINNYTGEPVRERRRQLGDREIIEVAVGQMEERIARGGNSTARTIQQAFPNIRRGRR